MTLQYVFRPIPIWPSPTSNRRYDQFKVSYKRTLEDLEYEILTLHGRNVVFGVGLTERDIRLDGLPRANARDFAHPGVEISFDSDFGRLVYATDQFYDWQGNVRAISLSLTALRAVDRYGVSKRGQQYAGYAQLAAGGPDPDRGRMLVERAGGIREALRRHHPDQGGLEADFVDVVAYRDSQAVTA